MHSVGFQLHFGCISSRCSFKKMIKNLQLQYLAILLLSLNFLTLEVLQLDACELRDYPIWISVFVLICQNSGHQQLTFAKTRDIL